MLCNAAHLYWQDTEGSDIGQPVRDSVAVVRVLQEALQLSAVAEQLFRGEAWSNPAILYMDVLDAALCLTARGCDVGVVEQTARSQLVRLASSGARTVVTQSAVPCWSDAVQSRFSEIGA
jgi:hypothetical protein